MSGILGVWNLDGRPVDRPALSRLSATLAHRGGDGTGMEMRGPVGLACRLSRITPEAAAETQPVVNASGTVLVFDGRLDNREELLTALRMDRTVSDRSPDSALALAAYRAFGDAFPERLNGDFALGLFDPSRTQMLLARDAVGVRPLYYFASRRLFLFASEVKALLAHADVVSHPDDDALADFLFRRLAGGNARGLTFFQNILSVLPAHLALITPETVETRRYWDFDPARQVRFTSIEESAEAFRHYFTQAVRRRMRSAAPVAVTVSGGLDSSAIFCVGQTVRRSEPDSHSALLGVSFTSPDGSPSDEKAFLVEIERAYDLEITRLENLPRGIMEGCREAVWHSEAPFLDANWNATHASLAVIRQLGARVLLTGHWGDQFLFDDAYLVDLCGRGAWRQAWGHVHEYGRWVDVSERWFRRRFFVALLKHHAPETIVSAIRRVRNRLWPARELRPWYTEAFRNRVRETPRPWAPAQRSASAHARSLYLEARSAYHVLCMEWNNKVAAMHGLEMAFPFLDRDLIGFLMAIPGEIQSWNGVHKGILRHALRGLLPDAIAGRVSKADFTGLVNEGMARDYDRVMQCLRVGGMVTELGYVRTSGLKEIALCKPELQSSTAEVSRAFGDVFALELWLQEFFGRSGARQEMEVR